MQKRRDVSELNNSAKLGAMLRNVKRGGDDFILEDAGRPVAAIIPIDRYDGIQQAREEVMKFARKAREAQRDVPAEEIEQDIIEAIKEVRSARHDL
jgi:prevent-host-death family protein